MVRIITDSTSDITPQQAKELCVDVVPLKVTFGNRDYIDKITITNSEFYEKLTNTDELPVTTLVSPGQFEEVFARYPDDDIVGIFISAKLSGTYSSACVAKGELSPQSIAVIDSKTVTCGIRLLVEMACKLRDEGKSATEIEMRISELSKKVELCAIVDTLKYLVKGGRLSAVSGVLGTALNIKPILVVTDGIVKNIGKQRGNANAVQFIVNYSNGRMDTSLPTMLAYTIKSSRVEPLRDALGLCADVAVCEIGSVVGTHAGPGVVGIAYFVV